MGDEPVTPLDRWAIIEVTHRDDVVTYHFAGQAWDGGRVSSPIMTFDFPEGVTRSGRKYILTGSMGLSMDALYVMDAAISGNSKATWRLLSNEEVLDLGDRLLRELDAYRVRAVGGEDGLGNNDPGPTMRTEA